MKLLKFLAQGLNLIHPFLVTLIGYFFASAFFRPKTAADEKTPLTSELWWKIVGSLISVALLIGTVAAARYEKQEGIIRRFACRLILIALSFGIGFNIHLVLHSSTELQQAMTIMCLLSATVLVLLFWYYTKNMMDDQWDKGLLQKAAIVIYFVSVVAAIALSTVIQYKVKFEHSETKEEPKELMLARIVLWLMLMPATICSIPATWGKMKTQPYNS